jgi:hypothetical protein
VNAVRRLVPFSVRRAVSAQLAHVDSRHATQALGALAASGRPIVAGPWLGEVGFELLYWAPFLRWCAERFAIDPARLLVLSRGGTAAWYEPFAGHYRDVLDYITPEAYHAHHAARVRESGEQKQTRITAFERQLMGTVAADAGIADAALLHPSLMYGVLRRFWWGHVGEGWVHDHARYVRYAAPPADLPSLPVSYYAVKFYFNDCFPATPDNHAFVRDVVTRLAQDAPVVSLSVGVALDDHAACPLGRGVLDIAGATPPSRNLQVQSAIVAGARAFVGTYGGFAYLAPFYGVPSIACYGDAGGFARSHLRMARSAFAAIGTGDLLHVQSTADPLPFKASA